MLPDKIPITDSSAIDIMLELTKTLAAQQQQVISCVNNIESTVEANKTDVQRLSALSQNMQAHLNKIKKEEEEHEK